jgi:trimeric autotransporter adhesin
MHTPSHPSLVATALLALAATSLASADTIFVNASQVLPVALQTGNSWAFAYKDLQAALAEAQPGDDIWVAKGTYRPTTTGDRSAAFFIPDDVRVFGGFVSGDALLADRLPLVNKTILSGDIGIPGNADNSFHVVRFINTTSGTVLCGFFVTGGNANGGGSDSLGAGIRMANSTAQIAECFFHGNSSAGTGSALMALGALSFPSIVNCVVTGNSAPVGGRAIEIQEGGASIFLSTIVGNAGGGIRFLNTVGAELVASCILRDNTSSGSILEQQLKIDNATVTVVANNIQGGTGFGSATIDADPKFADPIGPDGLAGTSDDNYALRGDSPCIDRGTSSSMPGDLHDADGDGQTSGQVQLDFAHLTRRVDDALVTATGIGAAPHPDMGAFEYNRPRTILVNHAATGANNGTSWTNAYTNLQDAIAELNDVKFGGPGEIWVAKGTYKPTTTTNQTISFQPGLGDKLFGGFAGGELSRSLRNPRLNETVLSGELGAPGPTGNSNHVVRISSSFVNESTVVDGFTVRDGLTVNGSVHGGGILIESSASPTIANCLFTANTGNGSGAVRIEGQDGAPTLINCVIAGNPATAPGLPGVTINGAAPHFINCIVAGNTAPGSTATSFNASSGQPTLTNCLLFGNTAGGSASLSAQMLVQNPGTLLSHTAIQGFVAGSFPLATVVNCLAIGSDGGVIDANGPDNVFGTTDDNYTPFGCSALVDAGTVAPMPSDVADVDDDSNTTEVWPLDYVNGSRLVDLPAPNVIAGANGRVDIGAVELPSQPLADADFNDDGFVDASDLALLLGAWLTTGPEFDLNGDCVVDASDLAVLLGAWSE